MLELSWDALGTWSQSESIIARLEELSHSAEQDGQRQTLQTLHRVNWAF